MTAPTDGTKQFDAEVETLTAEERQIIENRRRSEGQVINSDGTAVDVASKDIELFLREEKDGTWVDTRSGKRVELNEETGTWEEWKPWPHQTLDYMETEWEYRVPKPLAAMFLGIASRKSASAKKKLDAIIGYLEHTLSPRSMTIMMERAYDHDDEFDTKDMAELVRLISEAGSARPTS
ncbi:hypothetical protein SEA_SOOS_50 [Gordonia phage Soos]|nr:hypothetical protein SEA_SOOS_50 [Gordonia phage Soos]